MVMTPQCHQALFPLRTKVGMQIGTGYEANAYEAVKSLLNIRIYDTMRLGDHEYIINYK